MLTENDESGPPVLGRRRRAERGGGSSPDWVPTVVGVALVVGLVAYLVFFWSPPLSGGGDPGAPTATANETAPDVTATTSEPAPDVTATDPLTVEDNTVVSFAGTAPEGIESEPLPRSGREDVIAVVATEVFTGQPSHVSPSQLDYDASTPPTAGPHTSETARAGFYEREVDPGPLVHSLEHGAVVVYYDPEAITPEARRSLRAFADQHAGTWQSVVVVPHPGEDPPAYELTAWEHRLKLEEYDARAVRAFIAEYIGRGPENPVRPPADS